MTDKAEAVTYTFTSATRAGFINAVTPRAFQDAGKDKGKPRYDGSFILANDAADLVALKSLVTTELKKLFPGKRMIARRLTQEELDAGCVEINVPWKDGTKMADEAKAKGKDQEFLRGFTVIKASSVYAPALSAIQGGKVVSFIDEATRGTLTKQFYPGAWFAPHVKLHTYPSKTDKPGGCGLYLDAVCFVKDGPRLGKSGPNAAEVFKGYAGTVTSQAPGTDSDDEIPF